jgi:heme exporter protein A
LLEAVNLSCVRGDHTLFRELSFTLRPGELLHVTGRNGSGKTTLLRALCGLTRPAEGEVRWDGKNARALGDDFRNQVAYVGHLNGIQGELTPPENLRAAGKLSGRFDEARIAPVLEHLALDPYSEFPAKILSQGQKRRLALARLMLLQKPLWILDEPLAALDTRSIALIMEAIVVHLARGGIAVLTSHQELAVDVKTLITINLDA